VLFKLDEDLRFEYRMEMGDHCIEISSTIDWWEIKVVIDENMGINKSKGICCLKAFDKLRELKGA